MKRLFKNGIVALAFLAVIGIHAQESLDGAADSPEMTATKQNLAEIGKAIDTYREEKGDFPDWLSALVPKYLDAKLLICPADEAGGDPKVPEAIDPNEPCSYIYEFNPAWKNAKIAELGMFGEVVPIVRALHFTDESGEPLVINLSVGGDIYLSAIDWQAEDKAMDGLFETFKKNLQTGEKEGDSHLITRIIFELPKPTTEELEGLADATLETEPENAVAHKLKGIVSILRGNVPNALTEFETAIPRLPKDTDLFVITAVLYARTNRPDDAIEAFEKARKLQPDAKLLGWTFPTFAELYVQADRMRDAETLLAQYKLAMNPDDITARLILGDIYVALKRLDEATKVFETLDTEFPDDEDILNRLVYVYRETGDDEKLNAIQERLDPGQGLVGENAPDFAGTDLDGHPVSLESLRGKVVLLSFWATWCGPCMMEIPHLAELHAELESKGLVIVGVNNETEDGRQKAVAYAQKNIPYTVLLDMNGMMEDYIVSSIPVSFIIDQEGVIRHRIVGFSEDLVNQTRERVLETLNTE